MLAGGGIVQFGFEVRAFCELGDLVELASRFDPAKAIEGRGVVWWRIAMRMGVTSAMIGGLPCWGGVAKDRGKGVAGFGALGRPPGFGVSRGAHGAREGRPGGLDGGEE